MPPSFASRLTKDELVNHASQYDSPLVRALADMLHSCHEASEVFDLQTEIDKLTAENAALTSRLNDLVAQPL